MRIRQADVLQTVMWKMVQIVVDVPISGMNCLTLVLYAARKRIGGIKIVINRYG